MHVMTLENSYAQINLCKAKSFWEKNLTQDEIDSVT